MSASELPNFGQMDLEWKAWRTWCDEFRRTTGADINETRFGLMVNAIKRWGEELVALREADPKHTAAALAEARANCPRLVGEN